MTQKAKVIIITGPTAIGKTKLAIEIAHKIKGEIINADSVAVYKYFNIGSAKPTPKEQQGIKHHLLDELEPDVDFDVKKFQKIVNKLIIQINQRNHIPIIVGGTTFYIQALIDNYDLPTIKRDPQFLISCNKLSTAKLYEQLKQKDPHSLTTINPHNRRRIIRALELYHSGLKKSQITQKPWPFTPYTILLNIKDKKNYDEQIMQRIKEMVQAGLIQEVSDLWAKFPHCKAIKSIGYKEIVTYLQNKETMSLEEALQELAKNTRHLAKKQLTWMRNKIKGKWYFSDEETQIINDVLNYLEQN